MTRSCAKRHRCVRVYRHDSYWGSVDCLRSKYDIETNLSAALTCVSNVGPGFNAVGPAGNFAGYGSFAKVVLSLLMLAGRLELYPMLALLYPALWRKQ